jgi:hypothetical protein
MTDRVSASAMGVFLWREDICARMSGPLFFGSDATDASVARGHHTRPL